MPDRRHILRALLAAGLAPALMRAALAAGNNPLRPGLRKVSGPVFVNGRVAAPGMSIEPGDLVETGAKAEAIYVIGQDAFLQRADTRVQFPLEAAAFFRLVTGRLLSVFGRGEKSLRVPTATIGIRGTGCYLEATPAETYFCLCYGEAEVLPTAAPQSGTVIRTQHHDHPLVIAAATQAGSAIGPARVINHSDAELSLLESLVGRAPPFAGVFNSVY
ncbi:MAG: hypothetical protein JNJ60_15190 [Rhodocyclaceae bacterium]|nr:hypothetical protein [Rhodocyclaceae bacterium]